MKPRTVTIADAMRDEADQWLLAQPHRRALPPDAIAYWRSRFCLPTLLVESLQRDEQKAADARNHDVPR